MDAFRISMAVLIGFGIINLALLVKIRAVAKAQRRERHDLDSAVIQVAVKGRKVPRYQATADLPNRCRIVTAPYPKSITARRKLEKTAVRINVGLNWLDQ